MRSFGPFRLDEANQCVWRGETRIPLMPKPFAVLHYLVEHAGRLVTHDELLAAIWPDTFVQPEVLRRYILEIRKALDDSAQKPRFIVTRPKLGYEFIATVTSDDRPVLHDAITTEPTSLVGREAVLNRLRAHFETARHGQRQIVFVVGEPGIGKTSLVDAFHHAVAGWPDVLVARGQSVEGFGGKEPYYPVFEALGQLARSALRTLVLDTLTHHAPTWLIQLPALVRADQRDVLKRETVGATRERMVRELCEALETITRTTALVLILEDLHWVDQSSIDLISAISRRREPAKLLVVGTIRPTDLILSDSPLKTLKQDLLLHHLGHELTLEPLREADVADYLVATFGGGDLPAGLATMIYRQSDGNPLFMIALLDHLRQQGIVAETDGRWRMSAPLEDINPGVPETLKQMLELQMRHLSDGERRLLKCASVAGQRFTTWALATMLNDAAVDVEEECAALSDRQQFLKVSSAQVLSTGTATFDYEFGHSLYREVLYRGLTPSLRVAYHRRLAEGLEGLTWPVDSELAAELGLHFEEGRQYDRAVKYLRLAARNATSRHAHREAIAALERARELLPVIDDDTRAGLELQLLEQLGNAFYALGDMTGAANAYRLMATRAARSGLLAAQSETLMRLPHTAESIPFFMEAIELDPTLVPAYVNLSRIYSNLGDAARAREYARLAYDRRDNVGERERLSLTYQYHFEVTGNQSRATETLETWKVAFPREFQPVNSLAHVHCLLGRFERAVEEGVEAVRRNPSHGYPYSNLSHAYRGLGRFGDAQAVAEQAVALSVETLPTRRLLYQLAIIKGDEGAAQRHVDWARDRPREFDMIGARGQVLAWSGRVREARACFEDAARVARLRNLAGAASSYLAWATWIDLAYGNADGARQEAQRVLSLDSSYDTRLRAALTLAVTGSVQEAERIADELSAGNPEHTFINSILVPIVRGGVELARKQPVRAVEQLEPAKPYEAGFIALLAPIYLRAQSLLMQGDGLAAVHEFQGLLDHRGSDPFSPFHAVASLGMARGRAMAGDRTGSLHAYEDFLNSWTQADPDIPVLRQAREECDRLSGSLQP
jgi:DNA-binding winged helix-turn-helix (wHTH) protein/tetratricopeptide (TPR) repeat protein